LNPRHACFARVLSFLLLSFIAFSATFGVAHTHGSPFNGPVSRATKTADFARACDLPGSQTGGLLRSGDCSICQLHRQLSGGLLYGPIFAPAPPAQHAAAALATIPDLFTNSAPRRGRAPPPTSV
jgi:hypothetical protein